jgi:hypothetical protein
MELDFIRMVKKKPFHNDRKVNVCNQILFQRRYISFGTYRICFNIHSKIIGILETKGFRRVKLNQ